MDFKVEIGENDSYLYDDGVPKTVILWVTVNGKRLVFPCTTDKTLLEVYKALNKFVANRQTSDSAQTVYMTQAETIKVGSSEFPTITEPDKIMRGDIVECVSKGVTEEGDAREDLKLGDLYIVQEVKKVNGVVVGYEVVGQKTDFPMRVLALSNEVKFVKRPHRAEKKEVFEMIHKCTCGKDMVLVKNGEVYKGKCACGQVKEVSLEPNSR